MFQSPPTSISSVYQPWFIDINGDYIIVIINDDVKEYPIYEMENNPFMFQINNQIDYPKK